MTYQSKPNLLKEKSYAFALRAVKASRYIAAEHRDYVLSKQFMRSGTSIGANIEEAFQGASHADFINKLTIANKEAFETHYWLRLIRDSGLLTQSQANDLIKDCNELQRMLVAAIKTSKAKMSSDR